MWKYNLGYVWGRLRSWSCCSCGLECQFRWHITTPASPSSRVKAQYVYNMWFSMGTVGGVKVHRIHINIIHKAKSPIYTTNRDFSRKCNHLSCYFWVDFGLSVLQINSEDKTGMQRCPQTLHRKEWHTWIIYKSVSNLCLYREKRMLNLHVLIHMVCY